MPKRMVDDSLLNSPSMAVLSPRAQDAFVRFILLADDFGCLEVNARQLAAKGWPDRQDVTGEDVEAWMVEYSTRRAPGEPPVALLWTERARQWCFLTGWFGSHGQRRRAEYDPKTIGGEKGSKRRTPRPPDALVAAVMAGEVRLADGLPPGSPREDEFSREFPPGMARETQQGNASDSVPAREMQVSREFPRIPAAAVPDAVAVPVPGAAAVGREAAAPSLPSRDELLSRSHPATAALIDASGGQFAFPAKLDTRQAVEKAIAAAGPERALAAVQESYAKVPKPHLGWHLDALRAAAVQQPEQTRVVIVDLAWLDQLPEPLRDEAHAAWKTRSSEVESLAAPAATPRILASLAEVMRQEFTKQAAGATS